MNVSVKIPFSKSDYASKINSLIESNNHNEAVEYLRVAYANWMIEASPLFSLEELLSFPRDLFVDAIAFQMAFGGCVVNFNKFWEMVEQYKTEDWIFEVVLAVCCDLPKGVYSYNLAILQSMLGEIPPGMEVDNREKCLRFIYKNMGKEELNYKMLRKYSRQLNDNKNRPLKEALQSPIATKTSRNEPKFQI